MSESLVSELYPSASAATIPSPTDFQAAQRRGEASLAELPEMLMRAYTEVCGVLNNLRSSRDALQQATVERLQHTSSKLQEVTSATEVAATSILDGLDRAVALVDKLDALDSSGSTEAADVRNELRDELFLAQGGLQFQDITAQQLSYASSMLAEMEKRMLGLAKALDPAATSRPILSTADSQNLAYDPGATVEKAEIRQALADSIFLQQSA